MNIYALPADRLNEDYWNAWAKIQAGCPMFENPYFRPEFTQAVAAVRDDVEVGILEEGGVPVGFFPFQRRRNNVALPVGGIMSDFQGVVARPDAVWTPEGLLRGCRLSSWRFNHLLASQPAFRPWHWRRVPSPYIDLSAGAEAYLSDLRARHPAWAGQLERRVRRASQDAGPLQFELHTDHAAVFRQLVEWKRDQYHRTDVPDVLALGWTVRLLDRIRTMKGEKFAGVLSTLRMGNVLTAMLLSMRCGDVLHGWFSAYHTSFAALSPGLVLWTKLIEALPAAGVRRIDLGKGPEEYKVQLMSGSTDVTEGEVDLRPVTARVRRDFDAVYQWARCSPLRRPLLKPARFVHRLIRMNTNR